MPAGLKVACLLNHGMTRYRHIANSMAMGIRESGDSAVVCDLRARTRADVAVCYGWKYRDEFRNYPQWIYADLGYWCRDTHYRLCVNSWGPEGYVKADLPASRLESFGVEMKPWRRGGEQILILGASGKSMGQHGHRYMEWETAAAKRLRGTGLDVIYRPKPKDPEKRPLPVEGVGYDERPLAESLARAWFVVTHHSNAAIDALAAGVPVHCEIGAAAAFSVPLEAADNPPLLDGREQFLADVAWLQWSLAEMKTGAAWRHLKDRGLIRC